MTKRESNKYKIVLIIITAILLAFGIILTKCCDPVKDPCYNKASERKDTLENDKKETKIMYSPFKPYGTFYHKNPVGPGYFYFE